MKKKSSCTFIRLVFLSVVFCTVAAMSAVAQNLPRVGVAPLFSTTEDVRTDVLAFTISQTIRVNLDLLGGYEIQWIPVALRDRTPADLDASASRNRLDNIVFGSISQPDERTTQFEVALYDRREGAIIYDNAWRITSVFDVFNTADRVVEAMLGQFSDEPLDLGWLAINNTGTSGDYRVYVNDTFLGTDLTRIRILSGSHLVRVEQTRMFGRYVVSEDRVRVPENGTGRLEIAIPAATQQESRRLAAFPARVREEIGNEKGEIDVPGVVNEYIGIVRDLEEATYSASLGERLPEITAAFNEFVEWFAEPIVVEVEVEPTGPGRPVASRDSGSVLFRFSEPIERPVAVEAEEERGPFLGTGRLIGVYAGGTYTRYGGSDYHDLFEDELDFEQERWMNADAGVSFTYLRQARPDTAPWWMWGTRIALGFAAKTVDGRALEPFIDEDGERGDLEFVARALELPVELLVGGGGDRYAGYLGFGGGASILLGEPDLVYEGNTLGGSPDVSPVTPFFRLSAGSLVALTSHWTGQIDLYLHNQLSSLFPDFEMRYQSVGLSVGVAYHIR